MKILLMVIAIVPVLNTIYPVALVLCALIGETFGDWQIKSWLFETPGEKEGKEINK